MSIIINKEFMYQQTLELLKHLFSLPELVNVEIKGVRVLSIEEEHALIKAINECYHDMYSDVDIQLKIKLNRDEYNRNSSVYADCLRRLGFENDILGMSHYRTEERGEVIRICKTNGMRFDLIIATECAEKIPLLQHGCISEELRKVDDFWFIAIQALGKLMRRDYLISSHLAHMLIQEGLVLQMILRDKEKNTNIHRYGYAEDLEYFAVLNNPEIPYLKTSDITYNHIAGLLYSSVISFDRLYSLLDSSYKARAENYISIWESYAQKMV